MQFIEPDLELILIKLNELSAAANPLWGTMSPQRMIEHLTDTLRLSIGIGERKLEIPEDKVEKAQKFLESEYPMPQNFVASFANKETPLRNADMTSAIDEFKIAWIDFNEFYLDDEDKSILHPNFGYLNKKGWLRLHSKHVTHHLIQFEILK